MPALRFAAEQAKQAGAEKADSARVGDGGKFRIKKLAAAEIIILQLSA